MAETLVNFTDHPRKQIFRQIWAKPLLQAIKTRADKKLFYLGLPGIMALDIKAWIEHLNIVFAFQCLDEGKEYGEALAEYQLLEEYLSSLAASGKIDDYGLYKGYLEQIVMTGVDDDGSEFNQNNFVTVYNLDFCNPLSSPFPVIYPDTSTKNCYKLDAIEKLLFIQGQIQPKVNNDKFIMFLTVNSKFIEDNYDNINITAFKKYKKTLSKLSEKTRIIRLIRAYTFFHINNICSKYDFQAEFLPTMYYEGSGGYREKGTNAYRPTMMLTFTILASKITDKGKLVTQDLNDFLKCKFLFADSRSLLCHTDKNINENDFTPTPLDALQSSITYNTIW